MNKTKRKGFTLVELLVVIAIVGLLAAVSIPITTSFIDKAHLSNDIQTASNMSTIVKANQEDVKDYSSLKKAIVESFGSNFLKKLKPETSTKGNHYWYNVNEKQVEVKTLQEIRDSKEGTSFDNSFRSSIKKGYYLLDQEGDDELVSNTLTIENLYTRKECDDILSYFEQEVDIASSFSDKLNNTLIINNNGLLRGSMVDQINNIYFSNDYVTITKPIYFEFNNGEINFKSINESSPLLGLGMDNKVINIKSSMFFGTNVLLFKDEVRATLKVDVSDIQDLKSVFGARATNADIQINNDNNVYRINDDTVINKLTNAVVLRNLQYTVSLDVLNYQMPSVNEVTVNQEVSTTNNQVTTQVDVTEGNVSFTIPAGVKVDTTNLELSVTNKEVSEANIVLNNYATSSLDVHIEGINKNNDVPIIVDLGTILPSDVSYSLVKLYHVEDYEPVLMTRVSSLEELTEHNTYYYNKETGNVTIALKSFSELLLGVSQSKAWDGTIDTEWYSDNPLITEFHIKNAKELAGLASIINRDEPLKDGFSQDSFEGKTIYLDNDIIINDWYIDDDTYKYKGAHTAYEMGTGINDPAFDYSCYDMKTRKNDLTKENKPIKVFEPIGKDCSHTFMGNFNGQGHTVSGLYGLWYDDPMPNDYLGLFGVLKGPTGESDSPIEIKNLTISDSFYYYYGGLIGLVTSLSYGNINYSNITLKGNYTSQYNWDSGGIIGYLYPTSRINMNNILIDDSNFFESLWGSYDSAVGGLIGCIRVTEKKSPTINITNAEIFPKMNVYNDVASNYQWYSYRRSGMICGYISNDIDVGEYLASSVTYSNVLIHYDPIWSDYYYYKDPNSGKPSYADPHDWKFSRYTESQLVRDASGNVIDHTDAFEKDYYALIDEDIYARGSYYKITSDDLEELVHIPFAQLYGGGNYYTGFYNIDLEKLNTYHGDAVNISENTSIVNITDRGSTTRHIKKTGSSLTSPGEYTGYTFTGWNNGSTTVASYTVPSATSSITAVWSKNTYNISYLLNGGSYGTNHPTSATYDTEFEISNPTKTGYTFLGWTASGLNNKTAMYGASSANTLWGNGSTLVTSAYFNNLTPTDGATVTLTANWSPVEHTISFDANGGTGSVEGMTLIYDETYNLTTNSFSRVGYEFVGWALTNDATSALYADGATVSISTSDASSSLIHIESYASTSDITLYAVWGRRIYLNPNANLDGGSDGWYSKNSGEDSKYALWINSTWHGFEQDANGIWSVLFTETSATGDIVRFKESSDYNWDYKVNQTNDVTITHGALYSISSWSDGAYGNSSVITGIYASSSTISITNLPTGLTNNDEALFAWYGNDNEYGVWAQITDYNSSSQTASFTMNNPAKVTKFLIVQCTSETTMPSWEARGEAGTIIKKSSDQSYTSVTNTYSISSLSNYTKVVTLNLWNSGGNSSLDDGATWRMTEDGGTSWHWSISVSYSEVKNAHPVFYVLNSTSQITVERLDGTKTDRWGYKENIVLDGNWHSF